MTVNRSRPALSALTEKHEVITNDHGFEMKLRDINTRNACIRWGEYQNPELTAIEVFPEREGIISHFQVQGHDHSLPEKSFVVYKDPGKPSEVVVNATNGSKHTFFELIVSPAFFKNFWDDRSNFLKRFQQHNYCHASGLEFTARTTPAMFRLMTEMLSAPYTGTLNHLFIEAKATELLLLQITQFDRQIVNTEKLSPSDTERLIFIKEYLDHHFADNLSIYSIARHAGINQTRLKSGFKQLFHNTVFGHITELRLTEARRLLLEEKLYVSEVADRVGYKYPHYFAAAFKKRFGISPANFK